MVSIFQTCNSIRDAEISSIMSFRGKVVREGFVLPSKACALLLVPGDPVELNSPIISLPGPAVDISTGTVFESTPNPPGESSSARVSLTVMPEPHRVKVKPAISTAVRLAATAWPTTVKAWGVADAAVSPKLPIENPICKCDEASRETAVPAISAAWPPGEILVPVIEQPVGAAVAMWPATVMIGCCGSSV